MFERVQICLLFEFEEKKKNNNGYVEFNDVFYMGNV